ncbi:hypothetical protein PybrP1_006536 [[Pythium] brassicae (nom. inval.)]|nr:hypothetical protein PybrP1_006536 [[Pythium] brassicae (nom. inval.)]
MDGVLPATGSAPFGRRDSIQSEISVESDVVYRSLENGDVSALVGGPLEFPLGAAETFGSFGGSARSLASAADTVGSAFASSSGASALPDANARVVYVNDPSKNLSSGFCSNKVVTAKYTKLNFIPRFFYGRLSQVANFYFLLVGAGQIVPAISSTAGIPYQWIVLLIVLSIDAVFAAIEDSARHRADAKMNARTTQVFDAGEPGCFRELDDPRQLGKLPGRVICERPNHDVNNFSGRFEPQVGHTIPLDLKNIALRGSVIRNTPFAYGLVLNTGGDTKIMQSSSETPMKVSKILTIVNRGIGVLMAILTALCVLGAILCSAWVAANYDRATYLMLRDLSGSTPFRHDVVGWLIYVGYYWILIASFVPITLYVTIAIVKSYQTFFLNRDLEMYDPIGREAVRRLGKDLSASDILADSTPLDAKEENVRFIDPAGEYARDSDSRASPVQAAWLEAFLTHLAVCHSVVLEQGEDGAKFSASSPDELALVSGANFFGYAFKARKNGSVTIRVVEVTNQHLERYATEGLRTLVIAQKELPPEAFATWSREYKGALSDLEQRRRLRKDGGVAAAARQAIVIDGKSLTMVFSHHGEYFSLRIFAQWILEGLYEGAVCALVPALLAGRVDSRGSGYSRDLCGGLAYCCLITVGWAKLALNIVTWNAVTAAGFAVSFGFWYFAAYVMSVYFPVFASDVAFPYAYTLVEFYLLIYLSLLLCLGRDFLYKAYKREARPEYYHILQEVHRRRLGHAAAQWEPPELRYAPFLADLSEPKPEFEPTTERAGADTPGAPERQRAYTGFAFSTQLLEDRFVNPLREMVMPVSRIATALGHRLGGIMHKDGDDSEPARSFEERVKELPMAEQAVFEIQRFQVFAGWGSSLPGHLFISDPPRFTNAAMTDGCWSFDLGDWIVDNTFGGADQWEYGTKFKDLLRAHEAAAPAKDRRRLKKKLNKLVGRCVRRRRWVRRDTVLDDIVQQQAGMFQDVPLQ